MKLTEREKRFIKKMEKDQTSWRWIRWISLILSLISVMATSVTLVKILNFTKEIDGVFLGLAWLSTFFWFILFASSWLLGFTLLRWHGDTASDILLRLVKDHEHEIDHHAT